MARLSTSFDIMCKTKVDAKHGVIHGWAIVTKVEGQPYVDFHGDWIPDDAMYSAALEFADKARSMDEMHDGVRKGSVPFIYPMTADVKAALGLSGEYDGLAASLRPTDKAIVGKFDRGEYRGMSIGGKRILDEVIERETGKSLGSIDCLGIEVALGKDASPEAIDAMYEYELDAIAKGAKLERNKLRRIMRKFELTFISAVDDPAQEPARAALIKHRLFSIDVEKVASANDRPESDVKQEPTTMADNDIAKQLTAENDLLKSKLKAVEDREADLKKRLAREATAGSLAGDDRDHYFWLKSDDERDSFIGKSREGRDAEIKLAVIYKAKDGQTFRRGEERYAQLAKQVDDQNERLAKMAKDNEDADIAKAVSVAFKHLPEKAAHVPLMKTVRAIEDEAARKTVEKMLKTVDAAYATLFKNKGVNGKLVDGDDTAIGKMRTLAKSLQATDAKLTDGAALAKAAEQNPELYTEYVAEMRAAAKAN
jgi:hypothetical protein